MPARTGLRLGPGILTLGSGALAVQQQLTNCRVEPSENVDASNDTVNFMDGTSDVDDTETVTYTFVLAGNVQQDDLGVGSFIQYTWANRYEAEGDEQPFTFQPNTDVDFAITGLVKVVPVTIGGDAKVKNRSDFSFRIVGDPDLGAVV